MVRSSGSLKLSGSSKKKASSPSARATPKSMSRRIIRGDGRVHDVAGNARGSTDMSMLSQDRIMNVEQQAFERGYSEGERIGKQMGETMIETICGRYEKSIAELAVSHKAMVQAMEEQTVRLGIE